MSKEDRERGKFATGGEKRSSQTQHGSSAVQCLWRRESNKLILIKYLHLNLRRFHLEKTCVQVAWRGGGSKVGACLCCVNLIN